MSNPVHRIVLTGGPCGGKTTALSHITDRFKSLGYNVYVVPETATTFILGGVNIGELAEDQYVRFQTALTRTQMAMEDSFLELARAASRPALVVYDRGTMDASAFMSPVMWQAVLNLSLIHI